MNLKGLKSSFERIISLCGLLVGEKYMHSVHTCVIGGFRLCMYTRICMKKQVYHTPKFHFLN